MGQLRNALRAYLLEGFDPAQRCARQPAARHARRRRSRRSPACLDPPAGGSLRERRPPAAAGRAARRRRALSSGARAADRRGAHVAYPRPGTRCRRRRARALHRRPGRAPRRRSTPASGGSPPSPPTARGTPGRSPSRLVSAIPDSAAPTTSRCWCSPAASPPASRSSCASRRAHVARPAARALAPLAGRGGPRPGRGRRRAAGRRRGPPPTPIEHPLEPAPAAIVVTLARIEGSGPGSRSATTAAGTRSRRRPIAGAG